MAEDNRDLVLGQNQSACIQDLTKGGISVFVGPTKTSLANTDRPVIFNAATKSFDRATLEQAIQSSLIAPEGGYIVLENPARSADNEHPPSGNANMNIHLLFGSKVNIPGPVNFALWPGQVGTVLAGHRLRSNQYLLVRVYNEAEARLNWGKSVMVKTNEVVDAGKTDGQEAVKPTTEPSAPVSGNLTIGKLIVIRGDQVSFYIPPTGIEVVPDGSGNYTRDAVTLERLEYCMLLDENGNKRYVQGPAVVFPSPTEAFVEQNDSVKHRAIELNDDMGVFVKVTADYEEGGRSYKMGEELFITGKDQRIYYPREEHALIRYGAQERHYSVAVPEGEGRYILDKKSGSIKLRKGPVLLLPDPREHVIVRRVLEEKQVELWYPGNFEAAAYNARLREVTRQGYSVQGSFEALSEASVSSSLPVQRHIRAAASGSQHMGDNFSRGANYTPPRTLTLDTKYEGAVAINVWSNYAILLVNKNGDARVVVGPTTALLEYDETPQVLTLSTGKPKTTDHLQKTVYLKVSNNNVSDLITVETGDMVKVTIRVSYRVNFEGQDPKKWFSVENYVKAVCDHARSRLRGAAKRVGVEELNQNYIALVRDALLGKKEEGEAGKSKRTGMLFEENNMRVYEVEVLGIEIGDAEIAKLLSQTQRKTVEGALSIAAKERDLAIAERDNAVTQQLITLRQDNEQTEYDAQVAKAQRQHELSLGAVEARAKIAEAEIAANKAREEAQSEIATIILDRSKAEQEQALVFTKAQTDERLRVLVAEVKAVVDKAGAISPDLIAALQAFGDKQVLIEGIRSMAPLAILGGGSVTDVMRKLLEGTPLAQHLPKDLATPNGSDKTHRNS